MKEMLLSDALLNQDVEVMRIVTNDDIKRRLLDIGLSKGTEVMPLLESVSGGIRAYLIRNSLIAIREEDAKKIMVRRLNDE